MMETVEYNRNLPEEEKLRLLKEAKGGTWYDGWVPYCVREGCGVSPRMVKKDYGFECPSCKNMIGWNLQRLIESPTNIVLSPASPLGNTNKDIRVSFNGHIVGGIRADGNIVVKDSKEIRSLVGLSNQMVSISSRSFEKKEEIDWIFLTDKFQQYMAKYSHGGEIFPCGMRDLVLEISEDLSQKNYSIDLLNKCLRLLIPEYYEK